MKTITLLAGDGIGPEVSEATLRISAAGTKFEWESHLAARALRNAGTPRFPRRSWIRLSATASGSKGRSPRRSGLDSLRSTCNCASRSISTCTSGRRRTCPVSSADHVDIIVVRETQDLDSGLEHIVVPGVVESLKTITKRASTRIAIFAFEHARRARPRATAVQAATTTASSRTAFSRLSRSSSPGYPDIVAGRSHRRYTCMQLVTRPEQFDAPLLRISTATSSRNPRPRWGPWRRSRGGRWRGGGLRSRARRAPRHRRH